MPDAGASEPKEVAKHKSDLGYGPVQAVVISIGGFLISSVLAVIVIMIVAALAGWSVDRTQQWLETTNVATFLIIAISSIINLIIVFSFLKWRKVHPKKLGLDRPVLKHFFYALLAYGNYFIILLASVMLLSKFVPGLNFEQEQELGFNTNATGASLILIFVSLVIIPPLVEEFVVRGFLFSGLRNKMTFIVSALLTSAIFGAAHLGQSSEGIIWAVGVDTFILSMVLCYVREKTGSLWPGIGTHMIKNGVAYLVLFKIIKV